MGSCAGRRGEAEETAAIARTTTLTSVTVDGGLKLTWGAEAFPLALVRVQVFHVSKEENTNTENNTSDQKQKHLYAKYQHHP